MSLWRLEWIRQLRTGRLAGVLAAFIFCGLTGPIVTRYQQEIFRAVGGGVKVEFPPITVASLLDAFARNAAQIGLIVTVATAAGVLALDRPAEWSVFLRTRVSSVRELIVPRFAVSTLIAAGAFLIGTVAAWYETTVLLHAPEPGGMLAGIAFGALYYAFAVATVAWAASITRSGIAAVCVAIVVLLGVPVLGLVGWLAPWIPSYLVGSLTALGSGAQAATDFLRAAAVTVVSSMFMLWFAVRRTSRREL